MAGSCSEAATAPRRMDHDAFWAIKGAGYTDQQLVDIRLEIAVTPS
jgi:alkylhydroperoxidase family enzyme